MSGYEIEFDSCPVQQHIPNEIHICDTRSEILDSEMESLLSKGAIVPSFDEPGQIISTIFIVPKSNEKFRPVINLKFLNEFVAYEHFKQETFMVVLDLIQKTYFFTSMDLKDGYFSLYVYVKVEFQNYLKIS